MITHHHGSMTTIDNHKAILRELLEDIDEKIRKDIILERQKILGFALSEASAHMLAVLLLKNKLVSSGFTINHRYFCSEQRARERLKMDFPGKDEIIPLLVKQEQARDRLCYGRDKNRKEVEEAIANISRLKTIIEDKLGEPL